MQSIAFIFGTIVTLYSVVLLLRLIMQLSRADFRNPIGRGIVQLTDPLIRPLRRVLPPAGRIDTASVAALLLVVAAKVWLLHVLSGGGALLPLLLLRITMLEVVRLVLNTYLISILVNALLSFVAPGNYSPAQSLLASICDPVLNPIRRVIPSPTGLDLSPLWAILAIQALLIVLR
jgi:YggT family protein